MKTKDFIPPIIPRLVLRFMPYRKYGLFGNYGSWQEAVMKSSGYDSVAIVERVKEALLKVKNGEAEYERDSVLFDKIEYSWPLLSTLMWIAAMNKGKLNALDFGGSLGSTFFQNRRFFSDLDELRWNIVEQEIFVQYGKEYFQDNNLRFYKDIPACLNENNVDVLVLSCVLPYVPEPYALMDEIFKYEFKYIVFDRMPFFRTNTPDRIVIHKVDPAIYSATIPTHIFNEPGFRNFMQNRYDLVTDFNSEIGMELANGTELLSKGYLYQIKP